MVVSTVVAETTDVWAIWESYGGTEDWRSGLIPKLCTVRTCNVSGDGGQADTPDLQARHKLPQGAGPRTESGHHSPLHGYRGQFQKFAVWFRSGIQLNLCADSGGQFCQSRCLPRRGYRNPYDWMVIANSRRWQYHHCLGAIDGKHVAIRKPMNAGSYYFN